MNDHAKGANEQTQYRALEGIIRQVLKTNPSANIVMMAFVDPDKIKDYYVGKIPVEIKVHQDIAKMFRLPIINLAKEVADSINAKEFTWEKDFKNLHPSPFGQEIYFRSIKQGLLVELARPVPLKPKTTDLPKQADKFAYKNRNYLAVYEAKAINNFELQPLRKPTDGVVSRCSFQQTQTNIAACNGFYSG